MTDSTLHRHEVSPEDAQRLNRLSEEIRSRLTEIAFIVSRISGTDSAGDRVIRFTPREGAKTLETEANYDWLELVEMVPGLVCCYGSIGGETVLACPCA